MCNVALSGLPNRDRERVQSVINAAARLTTGARKYDRVTPLLRTYTGCLYPNT